MTSPWSTKSLSPLLSVRFASWLPRLPSLRRCVCTIQCVVKAMSCARSTNAINARNFHLVLVLQVERPDPPDLYSFWSAAFLFVIGQRRAKHAPRKGHNLTTPTTVACACRCLHQSDVPVSIPGGRICAGRNCKILSRQRRDSNPCGQSPMDS